MNTPKLQPKPHTPKNGFLTDFLRKNPATNMPLAQIQPQWKPVG